MKKNYQKPDIVFEDFSLSTNIAAGCEQKTNLPSSDECGVYMGGYYVFATGMTGCESWPVDLNKDFNGVCYHVPYEDKNLFAS